MTTSAPSHARARIRPRPCILPLAGLLAVACGSPGGTTEGTTEAATSAATGDSTEGSGLPTTGGPSLLCDQAQTAEECAMAHPEFPEDPPCSWLPFYTATVDADLVCAFEPAGGVCLAHAQGDTDCGSYAGPCGYEVFGAVEDDGTMTIARVDSTCVEYTSALPFILCSEIGAPADPPTNDELLCACGCAPDYPE